MANNIGMFQLEFHLDGMDSAVTFGTDGISWTDRRWSIDRARNYIASLARDYCDRYNERATMKIEWRGSVYLLDGRYRSMTVA